jgi:hypothetical protein
MGNKEEWVSAKTHIMLLEQSTKVLIELKELKMSLQDHFKFDEDLINFNKVNMILNKGAYDAVYLDCGMFFVDGKHKIKSVFENWQKNKAKDVVSDEDIF